MEDLEFSHYLSYLYFCPSKNLTQRTDDCRKESSCPCFAPCSAALMPPGWGTILLSLRKKLWSIRWEKKWSDLFSDDIRKENVHIHLLQKNVSLKLVWITMLQQGLCEQNCNLFWPIRMDAARKKTADLYIIFCCSTSLAGHCHPGLRIRQIFWALKCVSNKNMSQIKSQLLVKPKKRLVYSSAICCLYARLPPVTVETTACDPTFRSATPEKAPLANKQLLQKSCYVLHRRFQTSTG